MKNKWANALFAIKTMPFITAGLLAVGGCAQKAAPPTGMACQLRTQALDIRDNHKGRTLRDPIRLADIPLTKTSIGYGPALNPKAEITIVDGQYLLTGPTGTNILTRHQPGPNQGATFIVWANAGRWQAPAPLPKAETLPEISAAIGAFAHARGCGQTRVFPFKLRGRAKSLVWSATGAPKSIKETLENVEVTIVGIYDDSGRPKNAIMQGLDIHPHVYIKEKEISGHLNQVHLEPGAVVIVPAPLLQRD